MEAKTIRVGKVSFTSTPMAFYEPYVTADEVADSYKKGFMPIFIVVHRKSGDDKIELREFRNQPLTEERIQFIATKLNSLIRSAAYVEARVLGTDEQIAK